MGPLGGRPDESARRRPPTPRRPALPALLALCLAAGCTAPRTVGEYVGDRFRDAADCVRLSAGYGLGLHARAHVLRLPAIGYGTAPYVRKCGWDGPGGAGALAWDETAGSVFLPPLLWADADGRSPDMARAMESRTAAAGTPHDVRRVWHFTAWGLLWPESTDRRMYFRTIPPGTERADGWWLGADATIGYPSVRAGVNPVEIADLLLGFAGLDILGDDHWLSETESARAIVEAAVAGDAAGVRKLLRSNSRLVYARDTAHATPLYHAASAGHLDVVRALLEHGAHVDARLKDEDLTPVHAAARSGNRTVFDAVRDAGGRADTPGLLEQAARSGSPEIVAAVFPHHDTAAREDALRAAARLGRVRAARRLAELGVPLTIRSRVYHGFLRGTLLHSAAAAGHPRMIEFLIARGLDVNARDAHDMDAAARRLQPEVWTRGRGHVRWVLSRAAADRQTPLHLAASRGLIEAVKTLLEHGARPDARDSRGRTPLFRAARAGRTKTARALIAAGAGPALADEDGTTPLHLAAAGAGPETVELLLEHGADPSARRGTDGDTPLHRAALRGRVRVARLLLEHDADVDAKNARGWTPLRIAMQMRHTDLVRTLLEHGADVNRKGPGGTPLQLAVGRGDLGIAQCLIRNGADLGVRDDAGRSVLHHAARAGDTAMVRLLLAGGADPHVRDEAGRSPAEIAREHGHDDVADLLEKAALRR